jgi:hypothetical protein
LIMMNMILKHKLFITLILIWIEINHQNLIRKKLKMSLSLRVIRIIKKLYIRIYKDSLMKVKKILILQKSVLELVLKILKY